MNKVFMIGNLTRDPELTETASGVQICRFSIAVNRNSVGADGERKTDFFNCVAWRGLAETIARYCRKGNKVAISGTIETRSYEDSQGIKRNGIDIVAQDVEFLTPRSGSDGEDGYTARETARRPSPDGPRQSTMFDDNSQSRRSTSRPQLMPFDDDSDIPF